MIIKRTGTNKSARSAIEYIYPVINSAHVPHSYPYHEPHAHGHLIDDKRNELVTGINCRTDTPKHTYQDFKYFDKLHNKLHPTKIQTYDFVLSAKKSDFNPEANEDVYRFNQYATDFAKRAFGKPVKDNKGKIHYKTNYQILIAIQADNANAIPHAHLIVNNTNIKNLHSLPSYNRNIYRLRKINDAEVERYNKRYPNKPIYDLKKHYHKQPTKRQAHLVNLLHGILNDPQVNSMSKIRKRFKEHNISFSVRRPRRPSKYNKKKQRSEAKKHRNSRGVILKIKSRVTNHNRNAYVKLSSLAWYYHKKYKKYINYNQIKHNLALKRMGKFKPQVIKKQKPAPKSQAQPTAKPSKKIVVHKFSPASTNAAFAYNRKPNTSEAAPTLKMATSSASSSSENESENHKAAPTHLTIKHKEVASTYWSRFIEPERKDKDYKYRYVGNTRYQGTTSYLRMPYFPNNHHLEYLIGQAEDGDDQAKHDIDDFEDKCSEEDKQAIQTRMEDDDTYAEAKQSLRDLNEDLRKYHIAVKRARLRNGRLR